MSQAKFMGRLQPQNHADLVPPSLPSRSSLNRPVLTMKDRYYELSKVYVIFSLEMVPAASLSLQRLAYTQLPSTPHPTHLCK